MNKSIENVLFEQAILRRIKNVKNTVFQQC